MKREARVGKEEIPTEEVVRGTVERAIEVSEVGESGEVGATRLCSAASS